MASIAIRSGNLGRRLAKHLLRRATFFVTKSRIDSFANMTADQAVNALFSIPPYVHPEGPIDYENGGAAWLTNGSGINSIIGEEEKRQMVWYWFSNEVMRDTSIRHKMAIFWHSIFTTGFDLDWRMFDTFRLFQLYALGNVRDLAFKVSLDNQMLRYLSNNQNSKNSPNENYAREFLELFTILKGQQVSTDNYTNYTEHDIFQAARVFSGFDDANFSNKDPETGLATGLAFHLRHDAGNKQFSAAFNFQTIEGALTDADMFVELGQFVDMVFNQKETARAYVRRMYRFFVSDRISDEIEDDIIEPLATQLQNDGYEVENTLKILLKSVHFYDEDDSDMTNEIIGGKIKPPLELAFHTISVFDAFQVPVLNADPQNYFEIPRSFNIKFLRPLGWDWYPLSVEGYPGFFKSPNYSKFWYDQTTIVARSSLGEALLEGRILTGSGYLPYKVDIVDFVEQNFINIDYSDQVVQQFIDLLFCEQPTAARFSYFEEKLLGGVSNINWAFDWLEYKKTGEKASVEVALSNLLEGLLSAPEYQTF